VELLQMKGYGASRIQALLKKRRASNRAAEGDADLPLAELLARSAVAGCVSLLDFLNKPCPLGKMRGFKGFKGRLALGHQIDTELVYREIKLGKLLGCMRSGY
jgi:hypothetical protein